MRTYVIQSAAGLKVTITPAFSMLELLAFLIGRLSAHYDGSRKFCHWLGRIKNESEPPNVATEKHRPPRPSSPEHGVSGSDARAPARQHPA
jgi:hypothetical protein